MPHAATAAQGFPVQRQPAQAPVPSGPNSVPTQLPAAPPFREPPEGNRTEPDLPDRQVNSQCSTNEPAAPRHPLGKRRWTHDPQGHAPVCSLERR